jgi:hypothetical protein
MTPSASLVIVLMQAVYSWVNVARVALGAMSA